MKFLPLFFLMQICLCLVPFPAQAGKLEDSFAAAQKAYKENRLDEAAGEFGKVAAMLIKDKQVPQARLVLGNIAAIRIKQEKYDEAVAAYEQALKLPGKLAPDFQRKAWGNLAVCHHHLGEFALKADYLERLIHAASSEKKENLFDLYAQLGDAYKQLEVYSRAASAYGKAAELLPEGGDGETRRRILTGWGLCAGNLGDFARAEALLAEAMNGDGGAPLTTAESISNLGILKWEQGDYPAAAELLAKSLEIEKNAMLRRNEGVDSNNYGLVLKSAGRHENAQEYFQKSIDIAREVGNVRDEAIALSNRALVARITGDHASARRDYASALELYEKVGFREGRASTLLGLGKIYEVAGNDYDRALDCYRQANAIYEELEMPRGVAESLNQMGRALRKAAAPQRATRDLVFDDEEITLPSLEPAVARRESVDAYTRALAIAQRLGSRELIWSAHQGLGFALREEGKNADALAEYEKAIALVTAMRGSQADVELLGEYMKDKNALFTEAMELCAALHQETGRQEYMVRAMELDEILRNEIIKTNTQLVRMNYAEADKQKLYEEILNVSARRDKVASHTPYVPDAATPAPERPEEARQAALRKEEADAARERVTTLEKTFNELLAEWKKRYPEDAALFDSNAKIDTKAVQASLAPDELVLNYISLPDTLVIVSIAKEFVRIYAEPVTAKEIDDKIKKEFLYGIMEKDGRKLSGQKIDEKYAFQKVIPFLRNMYKILMFPVENDILNKNHLTIVSSGFLAQFPFAALVTDDSDLLKSSFLIENKEIINSRLSFFCERKNSSPMPSDTQVIAAANPRNNYIDVLPVLGGAENEVREVSKMLKSEKNDIKYNNDATETWFKNSIKNNKYNIMYFATHGMPFSDTYTLYKKYDTSKNPNKIKEFKSSVEYMRKSLDGISPLNGYLYMAPSDKDDGLLTIKEIMELPNNYFSETNIVVLSACNTGITFVPKSLKDDIMEEEFSSDTLQKELTKIGWVPGVDQISFVDTFMRHNINYTYGTLWFADDYSTSYILKSFVSRLPNKSVPTAYTETIRTYLKKAKEGTLDLGDGYPTIPQHPYFWACGAIFGH